MFVKLCLTLIMFVPSTPASPSDHGMLFPKESESRQIHDLCGMWDFYADSSPSRNSGFQEKWFSKPLGMFVATIPMPVPSSWNDIATDRKLRDFIGWGWYGRSFFVDPSWSSKRVVLRIDSAHYYAIVWVNGKKVMEHSGGHLPFEAAVNFQLDFSGSNYITIAVNNTLNETTLPPGQIIYKNDTSKYPAGYFTQEFQFDFFNYAGIHRRVRLYTTPKSYIDDITIKTNFSGDSGIVNYHLTTGGSSSDPMMKVVIEDQNGTIHASHNESSGQLIVKNVKLWWPYTMNTHSHGYLYILKVTLVDSAGIVDVYRQHFGIRTVRSTSTELLINDKPFYCHGVNKHEDSDIRGKGLDFALIARDFSMLKWLGVNCFRTSHYPYAEEIMDEADRQGIVVIDESPGVGIKLDSNLGQVSLHHHKKVMGELVQRDKNRPSVIMWSVANEPVSSTEQAGSYFKSVIEHTRKIDPQHRPVTFIISNHNLAKEQVAQYVDVLCINRYFAWYSDTGHTEVIKYQLPTDLNAWNSKYNKPVIMSEFGADTVVGLHTEPSYIFTEDYQYDFISEYHHVFDDLMKKYLVGELVWNFADFMTVQKVNRVVGNKKGLLTRQRQPKAAAKLVRQRYWKLTNLTWHYS